MSPYKNKEDQLACHRRYYARSADHIRLKIRQREKELFEWLQEYKRALKCKHCKLSFEDYPFLCDFHHIDGDKDIEISCIVRQKGWGKKRILKELDKCISLCANCHRIEHWGVVQRQNA